MITLQLVDIDYKLIRKRQDLLGLVSLSTFYCILIQYIVPKDHITWIHAIIMILPPIAILMYYFITTSKVNYRINGTILINDLQIVINRDSNEETFLLKDIKEIKIIYRAIDDLIFPEIKKQINQFWIEIKIEEKFYMFEYIVGNKNKLKFLVEFLKSFRLRENVKIYNSAKLAGFGMNKISSRELKKEYRDLIDNKLKRLKTTSANMRS